MGMGLRLQAHRTTSRPLRRLFHGDKTMRFLIKVAGTEYDGIFPSNEAAQADAYAKFPEARAVVVFNAARLK